MKYIAWFVFVIALIVMFESLLIGGGQHVERVIATAPVLLYFPAIFIVIVSYMWRVREAAKAAAVADRMEVYRFLLCVLGVAITSVDMSRIVLEWSSVSADFTICPITLVFLLGVSVMVDYAGVLFGFN